MNHSHPPDRNRFHSEKEDRVRVQRVRVLDLDVSHDRVRVHVRAQFQWSLFHTVSRCALVYCPPIVHCNISKWLAGFVILGK